ncbi:hypothetical protein B0A50_04863 [Salinomyces thailandicus]|uniref:Uncharacterized protein n=1 Tax=Salinomyces thailandicus TaxID=706561 RepID=A0A4U0U033_9PEZI|nr:hypothetical protein B0A50_04863 [Salinomyces thailandica]
MGRPPGAPRHDGRQQDGRGYYPHHLNNDWELREYAARYGARLEEVDSEDEGFLLHGNGYTRDRRGAGDELHFTGYDLGQDRQRRRQVYDYQDDFDSEEDYRRRARITPRVDPREQVLVDRALERMTKARQKGKTSISLSVEEMEALERRRGGQPPEPTALPAHPALASPPATPARTPKGKVSSRSNSSTSLASQKPRKRSTSLFGGQSSPSPAKSNSKAKVARKPSAEQQRPPLPYPEGGSPTGPPGIMVPGPDGKLVFAPLVNYSPNYPRAPGPTSSPNSPSSPKASSRSRRRRDSTTAEQRQWGESYPPPTVAAAYQPRYYYSPPHLSNDPSRPDSSSSTRSVPAHAAGGGEDRRLDWAALPAQPQRSASSTLPHAHARPPSSHDRRNVSLGASAHAGGTNPPPSLLRRVVPTASSPLAGRRRSSESESESESGSESESASGASEDLGVRVGGVGRNVGSAGGRPAGQVQERGLGLGQILGRRKGRR